MKTVIRTFVVALLLAAGAQSHPLGIFSINRYTKIELAGQTIRLHYVVDVAEIPTTQEFGLIDKDHDGNASIDERRIYAMSKSSELLAGLRLMIDAKEAALNRSTADVTFPEGQGGLKTIRLESVYECAVEGTNARTLRFEDSNFNERKGWKEIIVGASSGATIQESSVPQNDVTDALRKYPEELLQTPITVSEATVRFVPGTGTSAFSQLTQSVVSKTSDGFAELVSAKELSTPVILFSLLFSMALGAGHALTPGHGKTIVAAYLVGSRGTAKHALFLGTTVTITHTLGVFAMGLIALFASQYILPETLYPWLSFISGAMVVAIGISLFRKRLLHARGKIVEDHSHHHDAHHSHDHSHSHDAFTHTHDGHTHTHTPPGADGSPVTWKSLLALGVSGGLLPCPSAIVVLLSAVALGRIGFGLLLILAFSIGLAGVLSGIGFLMVYARRYFERFNTHGPLLRWLPVASALVVSVAGIVLSLQALTQIGFDNAVSYFVANVQSASIPLGNLMGAGAISVLGLGFVLGLKHALDADHLIAVSTIVSERKGFLSSSIVGALWGIGHTLSLLLVGCLVIALQFQIPERVALAMEFAVAAMLIILGLNVLWKLYRGEMIHVHVHEHHGHKHVHPHIHPFRFVHQHTNDASHHQTTKPSLLERMLKHVNTSKRSILIGMVHGVAGSAALMLIVLATIPSTSLALTYIGVFGVGSIGGMFVMSTLVGIPFVFTANKSFLLNRIVRGLAGTISVLFGLFLAWQIGFVDGLFIR